MAPFRFSRSSIDATVLRDELADPACGGYTSFEGWVRNHNEGLPVKHLEYEAFEPLAIKEGERIIAEAIQRFGIEHAACVHRIGDLAIGEMAVWVGVTARHRHEAFVGCRYIIDEIKHRVPIWKKEHYENGDSGWVNCERCAAPSAHLASEPAAAASSRPVHAHGHGHAHRHGHAHGHRHTHDQPDHHEHHASSRPDYSRQVALKEVGATGQAKLRASSVLVVGCGGLGVPVISYLAGAGIGRLGLIDGDRLEPSNLHRQTMYALADVGQPKADLAAARVHALNPDVRVDTHAQRLDATSAAGLIEPYDLVIDCTDNFATKFLLNDTCVQLKKPVIFSSVYQYEGQLQVVRPDRDGACLRCIWPEATRDGIVGNCAEAGVLGPVPGTFGSLQALEALKLLLDLPGQLGEELLVLDLLTMSVSRVRTRRAESCPEHTRRESVRSKEQSSEQAGIEVCFNSLEQALEAGFEVIDIREPAEVARAPAPSPRVRHIPMAELLHGKETFRGSGQTLLLCASGRRSLAAAQELRSRGQRSIYSLRGGLAGLSEFKHIPAAT
jgi:adenylyltransferase/sulfurtransferase